MFLAATLDSRPLKTDQCRISKVLQVAIAAIRTGGAPLRASQARAARRRPIWIHISFGATASDTRDLRVRLCELDYGAQLSATLRCPGNASITFDSDRPLCNVRGGALRACPRKGSGPGRSGCMVTGPTPTDILDSQSDYLDFPKRRHQKAAARKPTLR
jgi:hypothetical protein